MSTSALVGGAITLVIAFAWFFQLRGAAARLKVPKGSFGRNIGDSLTDEERNLLLLETIRQQRSAFALLWFAVAAGIILGCVLLGRIIVARELDLQALSAGAAVLGDFALGQYANRLYRQTNSRLDTLVDKLGGEGKPRQTAPESSPAGEKQS